MTVQRTEKIFIGEKEFFSWSTPLEQLWPDKKDRPKFQVKSSACWRGYQGTWRIVNYELYLINVQGELESNQPFAMNTLFTKETISQFAEWYSGQLEIPLGKEIEIFGDIPSRYERYLNLEVRKGRVIEQKIVENLYDIELSKALEKYSTDILPVETRVVQSDAIKTFEANYQNFRGKIKQDFKK